MKDQERPRRVQGGGGGGGFTLTRTSAEAKRDIGSVEQIDFCISINQKGGGCRPSSLKLAAKKMRAGSGVIRGVNGQREVSGTRQTAGPSS